MRIDPVTGAAFPGNPYAASPDPNKRRVIAYGLRNPFRFELRPGTDELWLGDVGWSAWEEIDRIADVDDATVENFGWPCYEGVARSSGYDNANLDVCENLYAAGSGAVAPPAYQYGHGVRVVANETCPTGSSSTSGIAFYPETGGNFPAAYRGGLFFADYSRDCIWWMAKGANGQPDPATTGPSSWRRRRTRSTSRSALMVRSITSTSTTQFAAWCTHPAISHQRRSPRQTRQVALPRSRSVFDGTSSSDPRARR